MDPNHVPRYIHHYYPQPQQPDQPLQPHGQMPSSFQYHQPTPTLPQYHPHLPLHAEVEAEAWTFQQHHQSPNFQQDYEIQGENGGPYPDFQQQYIPDNYSWVHHPQPLPQQLQPRQHQQFDSIIYLDQEQSQLLPQQQLHSVMHLDQEQLRHQLGQEQQNQVQNNPTMSEEPQPHLLAVALGYSMGVSHYPHPLLENGPQFGQAWNGHGTWMADADVEEYKHMYYPPQVPLQVEAIQLQTQEQESEMELGMEPMMKEDQGEKKEADAKAYPQLAPESKTMEGYFLRIVESRSRDALALSYNNSCAISPTISISDEEPTSMQSNVSEMKVEPKSKPVVFAVPRVRKKLSAANKIPKAVICTTVKYPTIPVTITVSDDEELTPMQSNVSEMKVEPKSKSVVFAVPREPKPSSAVTKIPEAFPTEICTTFKNLRETMRNEAHIFDHLCPILRAEFVKLARGIPFLSLSLPLLEAHPGVYTLLFQIDLRINACQYKSELRIYITEDYPAEAPVVDFTSLPAPDSKEPDTNRKIRQTIASAPFSFTLKDIIRPWASVCFNLFKVKAKKLLLAKALLQ